MCSWCTFVNSTKIDSLLTVELTTIVCLILCCCFVMVHFDWQIFLTHWGRDQMDAISQTTLSNAFSWMNENVRILINISLKFVPKGLINNNPALVQKMAWRRPGDKPLSEPMMVSSLTHICVTRPQWVKHQCSIAFMCHTSLGCTISPVAPVGSLDHCCHADQHWRHHSLSRNHQNTKIKRITQSS